MTALCATSPLESDSIQPDAGRSVTLLVLLTYAVLVLLLWVPLGPRSGMPYETGFAFQSQVRGFWDGFLFYDSLRVHTNFFYHLAFWLSVILGIKGSFVTYQIIYAILWWAHGAIVYFGAKRLLPRYPLFCFFLGALLLLHSSDHALNWVGQLNQFGMIFWMLCSFYFLILSFTKPPAGHFPLAAGMACLTAYMSLWSYESQLILVCLMPLVLLIACGWRVRNMVVSCLYWLVPLTYAWLNYRRYAHEQGTYQQSVIRPDFNLPTILGDLFLNIQASLEFWNWPMAYGTFSHSKAACLGAAGAVVAVIGILLVARRAKNDGGKLVPPLKVAAFIFAVGAILLASSFPVYLILNSARSLWRTQFLSGLGAVMFVGGLVALIGRKRIVALILKCAVGGAWGYYGTYAAYSMAAEHYRVWEIHRRAVATILTAVPSVRDGAVIVVTNVPNGNQEDSDPFIGDAQWFDLAMRLAYPNINLDATYYFQDGTVCARPEIYLDHDQWRWTGHSSIGPMMIHETFYNTILVRLEGDHASIMKNVPPFITTDPAVIRAYHPRRMIIGGRPSPMAIRRYIRSPSHTQAAVSANG
jgi:hypothetical protein